MIFVRIGGVKTTVCVSIIQLLFIYHFINNIYYKIYKLYLLFNYKVFVIRGYRIIGLKGLRTSNFSF